jgi:uncharacterized protein Yka (UPF0111/DUF47 family)
MNRVVFWTAFLAGAAAVLWVALGYRGSNPLALAFTALIGAVFILGVGELLRFRRATGTLAAALAAIPEEAGSDRSALERWLLGVDPTLHNAVGERISGERVGLPAPVFTPYLVGLLVMLGLLGTFVGMVVALQGAVLALEGEPELAAIRSGLAVPISGLGLAFGTSVAGVAASAMLGLCATLSRRERMVATGLLDRKIATVFRGHTLGHARLEAYRAMQRQADALPGVVERMHLLADRLETMGASVGERLSANQALLHESLAARFDGLASAVDRSLQESLAESGRRAGESIAPLLESTLGDIGEQARSTHEALSHLAQTQLETLTAELKSEFTSLREQEERRGQAALERLADLEAAAASRLAALGRELEQPMTRLIETASETPRVAAEVIGQLRREMSGTLERENVLLAERHDTMALLHSLSDALEQSVAGQRAAIAEMVDGSAALLQEIGTRFSEQVAAEAAAMSGTAEQFAGGAAEMASLGEAFGAAVAVFRESNEALIDNLSRIEESLEASTARSDEQMGYYVAQAREIIDQSMAYQGEVIEELRQLGRVGEPATSEAD